MTSILPSSSNIPSSAGPSGITGGGGANWINIRRDVKDPYYRYKMPRIQSKIEGKGNGIKTVIVNMTDVARALSRPPAYVTKYFGGELGTIVHVDDKACRYIVNGAHDAEKLQTLLDGFITRYVLCGECENPETDLLVSGRTEQICKQCKACGQRSSVDMVHRLVQYILKNPPPRPPKKKPEITQLKEEHEGEEKVIGMTGPAESEFAALKGGEHREGLDEDWAVEDAEAARRQELEGLSDAVKSSLKLVVDPLEEFAAWLTANPTASDQQIQKEIAERPDLEPKLAVVVIVQTLFDCSMGLQIFTQRLPLLQALVSSGGVDEQLTFLYSLERLVGKHRREFLSKLPALLQAAYNAEIVGDDALLTWDTKPSKRYVSKEVAQEVRTVAKPFIDWLNQNEEEEEDDDEYEDEGDE